MPRQPRHLDEPVTKVKTRDGAVHERRTEHMKREERSSSTFYLNDAAGPALQESELAADPAAFRLSAEAAAEIAGRKGAVGAKWNWPLFERAFVDGILGRDGERRWPSIAELGAWSGCGPEVVKNRAARDEWYRKKRIHEERLPALVEDAVRRTVAGKMGDYLAAADEAVAQKSGRQWLRDIAGPYLGELEKRLKADAEGRNGAHGGRIIVNAADGERLLRLMLAVEGEATERVAIIGAVQINLNLQRDATVAAISECAARGIIPEDLVPVVLETVQLHVQRVRWRYRVDGAELAEVAGGLPPKE